MVVIVAIVYHDYAAMQQRWLKVQSFRRNDSGCSENSGQQRPAELLHQGNNEASTLVLRTIEYKKTERILYVKDHNSKNRL